MYNQIFLLIIIALLLYLTFEEFRPNGKQYITRLLGGEPT